MSVEHSPEHGPGQITFEEIVSNAKEIMIKDGRHIPTLIIEGSKKLVAGQIPDMPATHGERLELMGFLGQAAAKSGKIDQVRQVFMVSEGWMSQPSEDQTIYVRPSQDPNRKEVLIISTIQIKEHKKQMEVFEIVRNSDQQVIRLDKFLPDEEKKDESVEVPLLDAFVQGFQSVFRIRYN